MLKKFKILLMALVLCLSFIPNVSFADNDETSAIRSFVEEQFDIVNFKEFNPSENLEVNAGIEKIHKNRIQAFSSNDGDSYEPNDSFNEAATIFFNQTIKANLHSEEDQDWYRFEIRESDVENCPGGIFTAILKDIPSGKDYDMYMFELQPDGSLNYFICEKRLNSVASYFEINKGTYYIAVFAKDDIPNNYSSQNYELYVGNALIPRSTGYFNTGMEFNFGFNNYPVPYLCEAQYINLSNESSLPENSLIKEVNVTSDGNGGYWIGFTKVFDNYKASTGLDYIHVPEYELPLKANHFIQAYITKSEGFVWKPRLNIDYVYPLIEQNYRFYF